MYDYTQYILHMYVVSKLMHRVHSDMWTYDINWHRI